MSKDIELTDWYRIFLGEVPPEFIFEVIGRMLFVYIIMVASLRLLGRRMESMLSRGEMVTLVTLGASVGVAIHTPERGILPSLAVIIAIILLQVIQARVTSRNSRAEKFILDQIADLIKDGRLLLDEMKKSRITRERLFAALRQKGIVNLGTVQRLYFESKGVFSVITYIEKENKIGLCVLPEGDTDFRAELLYDENYKACRTCGTTVSKKEHHVNCTYCNTNEWETAVTQ
ncbi:DUF421 domain-containing protein [Flavobacterium foetidum]|uniref:DUF421 domain-containing protein n=1 Tax=Flavobacterium foetidum TaxID=2026681 RepID=UPI0010757C95|nr:YetF domain-containing protein [Flavobacterium foetidum]KAF2510567.1 DUF421 domain-containing protein [Flavobacterium foetidum]